MSSVNKEKITRARNPCSPENRNRFIFEEVTEWRNDLKAEAFRRKVRLAMKWGAYFSYDDAEYIVQRLTKDKSVYTLEKFEKYRKVMMENLENFREYLEENIEKYGSESSFCYILSNYLGDYSFIPNGDYQSRSFINWDNCPPEYLKSLVGVMPFEEFMPLLSSDNIKERINEELFDDQDITYAIPDELIKLVLNFIDVLTTPNTSGTKMKLLSHDIKDPDDEFAYNHRIDRQYFFAAGQSGSFKIRRHYPDLKIEYSFFWFIEKFTKSLQFQLPPIVISNPTQKSARKAFDHS